MSKVRLNIEVSEDLAELLDIIAKEESVPRTEIVRRALGVMKTYREQIQAGRTHIGFTESVDKLDAELLGVLTAPVKRDTERVVVKPANKENKDAA
jgi:metal-responsive CopG/Arc/MetJ family transcriptional regulator